jgi:Helix-turn-helix
MTRARTWCRVRVLNNVARTARTGDNGIVSRGAYPELSTALGKAIFARRQELDKSQEAVAYESDMSIRQYQKLESGSANTMIGNVYAVAMALNLKLSDLAERAERGMRKRR